MPPALVPVLSEWPLAPSVKSVGTDKGDNEMIPGAGHNLLAFTLSLGKALRDQSSPQMGSLTYK